MEDFPTQTSIKSKIAMNSQLVVSHIFPDPRKLPPFHPLPSGFYPAATSLEEIKLRKKRGSPSEGSDIAADVISVVDNPERDFFGDHIYSTRSY